MVEIAPNPYSGVTTGIGSMPGTDPDEAASIVFGELPELPHLPELPARGVGADMIGRSAGLLVDLPVEAVPSGYRVTARPGRDHRRAVDLMRRDLDALQRAVERTGGRPRAVKAQVAGPWTLCGSAELATGHRVLTDAGALREFATSLVEGVTAHVAEVRQRTGLPVAVQLDEPSLPAVLRGGIPTPSGYGHVPAVPEPDVRELLTSVIAAVEAASGHPVVVHCCAARPPLTLLRAAGAGGIAVDATRDFPAETLDELGEVWEAGTTLLLGLVPTTLPATDLPGTAPGLHELASPALALADRLGFSRRVLTEQAAVTPVCGLAGAGANRPRAALTSCRELARAFAEPPESW